MKNKSSNSRAGYKNTIAHHSIKLIVHGSWLMALFLAGCENDPGKVKAWTEKVIMKEEAIDIDSWLSQGGKMKARLKAPLMLRVSADTIYVEFPNSLHVDFYNDSAQVETTLDSRYGKYLESFNKVYLRDSVIVITTKGDTLKSPDLWWDQNTKLFYTDKVAYYSTKDRHIASGKGLEATQDLSRVTFNYLLYSTIKVAENGFPK